jgi:hypothetical protein
MHIIQGNGDVLALGDSSINKYLLASRGHPFFSTVCFLLEELILFIFVSKKKFEDT